MPNYRVFMYRDIEAATPEAALADVKHKLTFFANEVIYARVKELGDWCGTETLPKCDDCGKRGAHNCASTTKAHAR